MNNENFEDIYAKYQRFSTKVALKIVKDSGVAEDITQEVFYNLYKMGSKLDVSDEKKLRSFILTVTANKAKDYLKKAHVKRELAVMDDEAAEEFEDKRFNVEAKLLCMEERKFQSMVLMKLREENRMNYEILVKVKYMDIPPETVAKEYNITRNNVNNRILRTKLWLEKELSKLYKD